VIVVDDGSRDDSVQIASSIAGVRVIPMPNRGPCAARNTGIAAAEGDRLLFSDHDDRLLPDAIEIGLRELEARPDHGFVYGYSAPIDELGDRLPQGPRVPVTAAGYGRMLEGDVLVPPGCALFRRRFVEAAGGFREGSFPAEDYDLYLRVARIAPVYCHNREVVEYRCHAGNASRQSYRQLRAALAVLEEQLPLVQGDPLLERSIAKGRAHWARVFAPSMAFESIDAIRNGELRVGLRILATTLAADPRSVLAMLRHFAAKASSRALA
jgi:glycosyltransferase involved in cell wall biosynthesis